VTCQRLQTHRLEFFDQLETILEEMSHGISSTLMKDPATLTLIILDCSSSPLINPLYYARIEVLCRGLCYALHLARSNTL